MAAALPPSLAVLLLAVLPVVVAVAMFAVAHVDRLAVRRLPQRALPRGEAAPRLGEPVPRARITELEHGQNLIWPPLAAFLVAPLTLLSPAAADWAIALARARVLHALAADRRRARLARVRRLRALAVGDRRDPRLAPDARSSACSLALAWRYRDRAVRARARDRPRGRDQVLPLAARRLARRDRARREPLPRPRPRSPARSLLLVLPFTGLDDYVRGRCSSSGGRSTRRATPRSASSSRPARREPLARVVTFALGAALLVGCWRRREPRRSPSRPPSSSRRSCGSTTTPSRRSRSPPSARGSRAVWLAPLATWGLLSAGIGAGNGWGSARVLIVFAIVFAVIVRAERQAEAGGEERLSHGRRRRDAALVPRPSSASRTGRFDATTW